MFSGNKNKSGRKKLKPLYLAEGGFSLTPPGPIGTNPKTKTTVPFPQSAQDYMKNIGANPKYKNLDSSKILQLYSKDKSSWPKSLDIIEEDCSEPGKCGKTLRYSVTPTPPVYNWSNNKPAATAPKVTPSTTPKVAPTVVSKKPTLVPPPASTAVPVTPPAQVTPKATPQTTAPGNTSLIQRWQYMSPQDRARALQVYGSVDKIPTQGADVYELRKKVPTVSNFKSGGQTKNDKAMVSGVSSILRKIKDKKNRKEVAGDMVKQFNREGVNYNKEKFLKNSRSFQGGGRATRADSIAVLNSQLALNKFYDKEVKAGRIRPFKSSIVIGNTPEDLNNLNKENLSFYRHVAGVRNKLGSGVYDRNYKNFYNFTPQQVSKLEAQGIATSKLGNANKAYYRDIITPMQNLASPFALIDSRIKPQGMIDYGYLKEDYPGGNIQVFDYDPLAITPWDMLNASQKTQRINKYGFSGTPYKNKADYINKTTAAKTPKPATSTIKTLSKTSVTKPKPAATTSSTLIPPSSTTPTNTGTTTTTTTSTNTSTTPVQTPKQVSANTPQMQRYNYMSTDDKKRAVKKYGDSSKVPFQGIDVNQLRREVPTFKKGGQHGGLDRWFAEKWVDVKSGKPCGRQEGESRAYPACRPSKRISSKTPKTSSELSSKEKARFKATKTSSQRIPYNHKRK